MHVNILLSNRYSVRAATLTVIKQNIVQQPLETVFHSHQIHFVLRLREVVRYSTTKIEPPHF